jgi:hypothetical protein
MKKRCGCGRVFSLPHIKSRQAQCGACARPRVVAFSPDQCLRAARAFCLFASGMTRDASRRAYQWRRAASLLRRFPPLYRKEPPTKDVFTWYGTYAEKPWSSFPLLMFKEGL